MAESGSLTGRITLTKAQLASDHGRKLIELILEIGLDGELSDIELSKLSEWLSTAPNEIPAIRHLRELVADGLADGFISDEERKILHKQIERVLPATERERLVLARKSLEEKKRAEEIAKIQRQKEAREAVREIERSEREYARNKPTEAQLQYIRGLGGSLNEGATKQEASVLIERLLNSNGSISVRQRMVLRFWDQTPNSDWGKAQVSVWMDQWYQEDPDRQLAWELFKEETGDTGTARNAERVPIGIGHEYLKRIQSDPHSKKSGCLSIVIFCVICAATITTVAVFAK